MANVQGKFYTSETQRRGVTPSSPPNAEDDPQDPVSPSSPVSFITLTDTPSSYSGQTLKGVRVNAAETGLEFYTISSGGLPPIDGSYGSQALMIADQSNQTAQYIYFDGTEYWEYLGTTTPSIADYRAISAGGGGTDPNAVHYNFADGKNAAERNQARINIGSTSSTSQVIATAGAINNLSVTSNHLVFTGASVVLSGIVAGLDGEEITIFNNSGTVLTILNESALSTASNRFTGGLTIPNLGILRIKYRTGSNNRWFTSEGIGLQDSRYLRRDINDTSSVRYIFNPSIVSGDDAIKINPTHTAGNSLWVGSSGVSKFRITTSSLVGENLIGTGLSLSGTIGTGERFFQINATNAGTNGSYLQFYNPTSGINVRIDKNGIINCAGLALNLVSGGGNVALDTTTGTKIGTASTQKLAFWNKTPIIQPTTGITGATLVGGGGTTITDTDTFGGYTIAKAIAALINTGILA